MPTFDPYHKWLSIPAAEQPPNHYRLLGVPLLESDLDVIEAAAERQTLFLRTLQLGPQSELAERILNEVARARVTLLNTQQKVAYDDQLRESLPPATDSMSSANTEGLAAEIDRLREQQRRLEKEKQSLEQEHQSAQATRNAVLETQSKVQERIEVAAEERQVAEAAQRDAREAQAEAEQERQAAESAQRDALEAQTKAEQERQAAESAQRDAREAQSKAEQERQAAEAAQRDAREAQSKIQERIEAAEIQRQKAEDAQRVIQEAQSKILESMMADEKERQKAQAAHHAVLEMQSKFRADSDQQRADPEKQSQHPQYSDTRAIQQQDSHSVTESDRAEMVASDGVVIIRALQSILTRIATRFRLKSLKIAMAVAGLVFVVLLCLVPSINRFIEQRRISAMRNEGLVAYYPFNGNAKDASPNGNNSVSTNATLTKDRFGTPESAFSFRFSDKNFIECNDAILPAGNSPRTVTLWFTDGHPQSRRSEKFSPSGLFAYGGKGAKSRFYGISLRDGELSLGKSGGGDSPTALLTSRDWTHAVWSFDGAIAEIFINGKHSGSANRSFDTTKTGSFKIGDGWIGDIDDVRIYNRALSEAEVKALYNVERSPQPKTKRKTGLQRKPTTPPLAVAPFKEEQAKQHQQSWADYLESEVEVSNDIGMEFVLIPPGEFTMGSPKSEAGRKDNEKQHLVQIAKPFYLGAHEVTQAQYKKVMGKNLSYHKGENKPVERISWNDAVSFCNELSKREREEYRLPTEAEWEYACRAGTTTAYSFGEDASQLGEYAWYKGNSGNTTHPVGEKLPNGWGLYDMHGNVWEWCQDALGVLRGGARDNSPGGGVRTAYRYIVGPEDRSRFRSFRVARTYDLSSAVTGLTVDKPTSASTQPNVSPDEPDVVAVIKDLMTPEQKELGGPIVNSVDMVLVSIPPGDFTMGSPKSEAGRQDDETQHLVRITKPFYLSAQEVTQQQYQKVMGYNPSSSKGPTNPVEMVSWHDAVDFCRKLSDEEGVEYRLPTEAEWEYACRAGTTTVYSFGNDVSQLGEYTWYDDNSTHVVGQKRPNRWGLYDMHGNIWEWCQDWKGGYGNEKVVIDPTGPASGRFRQLRGGFGEPLGLRSAYRGYGWPRKQYAHVGFRLARTYSLSPITSPAVDEMDTPPAENAPTTEESVAVLEKLGASIKSNERGEIYFVHLMETKITDEELVYLRRFSHLKSLALDATEITDAGLIHLQGLTNLLELRLNYTKVTDAGLVHLAGLTNLETLMLLRLPITDAGLGQHLKGLTNLRFLALDGTQVTDTGLVHLNGMTKMGILFLENTQISDKGLVHLKGLTNLHQLHLRATHVTDPGVAEVTKALPKCRIYR